MIKMDERNENIVVLLDDEGQEYELEILDILEYKGKEYAVGLPADTPEDEEEATVLIMRIVHINDEEDSLEPIENEEELQAVFEVFKTHADSEEFEFEKE